MLFSSTSANTLPSPDAPVGSVPCLSATQVCLGPAHEGEGSSQIKPQMQSHTQLKAVISFHS